MAEKTRYSRFPICENGDLDKTLGVVHIKDLYALRERAQAAAELLPFARKLFYIPETAALMFSFRAKGLSDGLSAVLAILSNLPQSIVALPAFSLFSSSALLMQWGMGMAAGCMMYSVSTDIYPEAVTAIGSPRARTVASLAGSLVVAFDIYSHIHIR